MIYFGVDIGVTGAVAMLEDTKLAWVKDTPIIEVTVGKKKRNRYNVAACYKLLQPWIEDGRTWALLEDIRALPKMSSLSAMMLGVGRGMWEGVISSLNIPLEVVQPTAWKKTMLAGMEWKGNAGKEAARAKVCQLFPESADHFSKKKHHNRAEAVLQAEYLRRMLDKRDPEEASNGKR